MSTEPLRGDVAVPVRRRRLLAALALGAGALAGCASGRSTPTLTPAPLPESTPTASPTPPYSRFSVLPCPPLDGPTTCAHNQSRDARLRFFAVQEVVAADGEFRAVLVNRGDEPVPFAPRRWRVWTIDGLDATETAGGRGDEHRELAPGERHEWLLVLGARSEATPVDGTEIAVDLAPGRYAFGVPVDGRTYVALFDVVARQPSGDASAV